MPQSKSKPITRAFRSWRIIFDFVPWQSNPCHRGVSSGGLDGDVRHLCQILPRLISAICHVLRWQMTAWHWQRKWGCCSPMMSLYLTPFPVSWPPTNPLPSPTRGKMSFEVNTICFVAFLRWLNNGLKYVAKWESEVGDGSNLAFLSERWHRPIEINEGTGVFNTFPATTEIAIFCTVKNRSDNTIVCMVHFKFQTQYLPYSVRLICNATRCC